MPKSRQGWSKWQQTRARIWERDNHRCVHCGTEVAFREFHCDHIRSGKLAGNEDANLRTLCRRCHVLRADNRHRGMEASALRDGVIPADWRKLVWEG